MRNDRRRMTDGRRHDEAGHGPSAHRAGTPLPSDIERWAALQEEVAERMTQMERQLQAASQGTEWLTAAQAAAHLGMSVRALYSAVERRQVPTVWLGRRLRFNRAGLDRLLSGPRGGGLRPRVPSPGKESERW